MFRVGLPWTLDRRRGGAVTKVAVFMDALDARTTRIQDGSWAEKLRRLCIAVLNDLLVEHGEEIV